MGKKIEEISKIEIAYEKTYDYKSYVIHGVYGGIGGNGFINMNFFVDKLPLPIKTELEISVNENRIVSENPQLDTSIRAIRDVYFGALFDIETAKTIHNWLGDHIAEYEKIMKTKNSK